MRFLFRCLLCLFLLQPVRVLALQSSMGDYEDEFAAVEARLADAGDDAAWDAWRNLLSKIISDAEKNEWSTALLNELSLRGKGTLARHAGDTAAGLRARALWADALREMAKAGADLQRRQGEEFTRGERKQMARLWLLAHLAWQDYLLTEESVKSLVEYLGKAVGLVSSTRDTNAAWTQWWICLRNFCAAGTGGDDRDISLSRAAATMRAYTKTHPQDINAWRVWTQMLLWRGERSSEPAVRAKFFEDASNKYWQVIALNETDNDTWLYWIDTLRTLSGRCASKEECKVIERQLEIYSKAHEYRFAYY